MYGVSYILGVAQRLLKYKISSQRNWYKSILLLKSSLCLK